MLRDIYIRNVAIIDETEVEFGEGLNLLTGETGAGKSIIIDSLGLALGNRGSADLIRSGAKEASVQAVFTDINQEEFAEVMVDAGIECGAELILRRRYTSSGVSRAYVNDTLVNLATLKKIGERLVTIHGQGEGDELLQADGQMSLLDDYANNQKILKQIANLYYELTGTEKELNNLITDEKARAREIDLLEHQIEEIETAKLDPDEETELQQESKILMNAERLQVIGNEAYSHLYDSEHSVIGSLSSIEKRLEELSEYEVLFKEYSQRSESIRYQLEDLASEIRDFVQRVEADPRRLAFIEERLDVYKSLKRKYGDTTEEVLNYLQKSKQKLDELKQTDDRREELESRLKDFTKKYDVLAAELTRSRNAVKADFSKNVEKHLADLAMEKAKFSVDIVPNPRGRTQTGVDSVTFMLSPNPGEELKPLAKIASGGEQSRLMLAIKSSVSNPANNPAVIFDEVDTGIGGRVAEYVGRKLHTISRKQQVICITHLPQIAAYAEQHSRVNKKEAEGRTVVEVEALPGESQVQEIARMLGGESVTDSVIETAREMVNLAKNRK